MELKKENYNEVIPPETSCVNGIGKTSTVLSLDVSTEGNGTATSIEKSEDTDSQIKSDIPKLLKLVQEVYNQRLLAIDNSILDENERKEEKLSALQSYVTQLEDQNDTFASTMIELEEEALQRVKQMEKRLKSSAKTTMEAVLNMHECEKEMRRLVEERLYIESLYKETEQHLSSMKVENGFLRDQNFNLNHDVQALLRVIHDARSTGHWEMDCVTFCEVTPEQVFGPVQSLSLTYSPESDSQMFDKYDKAIPTLSDRSPGKEHYFRAIPKNRDFISTALPSTTSLLRCVSLPDIGNIYSYSCTVRKSNSDEGYSNNKMLGVKLSPEKSSNSTRQSQDTDELIRHASVHRNLEHLCNNRGQSEPHLFMFNDNVYKYRPCETVDGISNTAISMNYPSSLPAYQSIDLKFPTEEPTLKDNISNSSSSCTDSEIRGLNKQMLRLFGEQITSCIQPDTSILKYSVGLQTETDKITQGTQFVIDDNPALEMELSENNLVLLLKDNLTKAENKAEAKGILIEQLQNHLTSAVKEVELKDKVLENLEIKLQKSREECSSLKNEVGNLNFEIKDIHKDLEEHRIMNSDLKLQMEQQSQIIRTLQEALVQSKRAFDAAQPKMPLLPAVTSENLHHKNRQPSKSSIVDI